MSGGESAFILGLLGAFVVFLGFIVHEGGHKKIGRFLQAAGVIHIIPGLVYLWMLVFTS
jgi:hypothetical protein